MKWQQIPHYIRNGSYEVNISLGSLVKTIAEWKGDTGYSLILNPDFQRGHVWTLDQQVDFVEYFLSGGMSGRVIFFNKPSWQGQATSDYDDFVCVDGLQRVAALSKFMMGQIKVFGQFKDEFGDNPRMCRASDNLRFNVNSLKTKREVLQWYIQMNSGGTPHTKEEIEKVKALWADC